jgi:DNA repair protein RadC
MSINDWPLAERPREKLLARGAAALSDAELLAIFLRTGIKGMTAVDMARHLLAEFGSLPRCSIVIWRPLSAVRGWGRQNMPS